MTHSVNVLASGIFGQGVMKHAFRMTLHGLLTSIVTFPFPPPNFSPQVLQVQLR